MMYAESRAEAEALVERFASAYAAKYPKAAASLTRDQEHLYSHFDFPAEHWKHIRSTNVIESAFATVRLRQRVTKGAGSRSKGLTMAFSFWRWHSNAGGNSTLHNFYPWCWQEHGSEMACRKLTERKRIERLPLGQTSIHNI